MTLEMQTALERELKDAKTPEDLLAGEIRTAQTEMDNAAALAKANAPVAQGGAA